MSLAEMLPDVQSLSRTDKLRLIAFLARDLAQPEDPLLEAGRSYPVWSPHGAYDAAAKLLAALQAERGNP